MGCGASRQHSIVEPPDMIKAKPVEAKGEKFSGDEAISSPSVQISGTDASLETMSALLPMKDKKKGHALAHPGGDAKSPLKSSPHRKVAVNSDGDKGYMSHGPVKDFSLGGGTYTGELFMGIQEGKGTFYYANGDWYDGEWKGGYRHGKGTFKTQKGIEYVGDWDNDRKHGSGKQIWPDGRAFDGQWRAGLQEGSGFYSSPDGTSYIGTYSQGKRDGSGVWTFANGDVYSGPFVNDCPTGKGRLTRGGVQYDVEHDGTLLFSQGAKPIRMALSEPGAKPIRMALSQDVILGPSPKATEEILHQSTNHVRPASRDGFMPMIAARAQRPMSAERVRPRSAERVKPMSAEGGGRFARAVLNGEVDNEHLLRGKGGVAFEDQAWDIFINYRVDADAELVEKIYDKLNNYDRPDGKGRLRVFWDKKCLVPGLGWEEGFVKAVCNSRVVVLVMSRKTFVNPPKYDVTQLTSESSVDNVILEYELVLDLFDLGRIKAVLPLLVGDLKDDPDMGGEVFTHFFSSGCLPVIPNILVPAIQSKALSYIRSDPELDALSPDVLHVSDVPAGTPSLRAGRTLKQTVSSCLSFQGHFVCGPKSNSIEDAVAKVLQTNEMFDTY